MGAPGALDSTYDMQTNSRPGRFFPEMGKRAGTAVLTAMVLGCGMNIEEPVGISLYSIINNSADTVYGVYKTNLSQDTTPDIAPGANLDFFERGDFGRNPLPSESLLSLKIFGKQDLQLRVDQEPILDSLWSRVKLDNVQYGTVRFSLDVSRQGGDDADKVMPDGSVQRMSFEWIHGRAIP